MLYVTTRDDLTAYTSERAMRERRAPDGGFYIPYRLPKLSVGERDALRSAGPEKCISSVVSRFMRSPDGILDPDVRLDILGNRVGLSRIYPKSSGSFRGYISQLADRLYPGDRGEHLWLSIGVRIGAVAASIMEYLRFDTGIEDRAVDIAMVSGDLFGPMSAYLAREMGFPVGKIICCCNENSAFWDLLHHGQLRTDLIAVRTSVPETDVTVPDGLECLIALCCGREETGRYLEAMRTGSLYAPGVEHLASLKSVFRSVVVTGSGVLRGVRAAHGAEVSVGTALALAGLLDYRAGSRVSGPALVIAE